MACALKLWLSKRRDNEIDERNNETVTHRA
jgi:hypothetical protein